MESLNDMNTEQKWTPPKTRTSDNVCPRCASRATKIWSISTGLIHCQICKHDYPFIERK